jgi:tripeptide aminopeptidase
MSDAGLDGLPEVARLMARLCEIPSVSGTEAAVADVVRAELTSLGAEITEDDAAAQVPAGCGNIVARFAATAPGIPVMFGAHLDTVPQTGPIEIVENDGVLTNRHATILGGDNKSAVATLITAMRRVVAEGRPHAGIEILMTPCEEIGLRGATLFDPSRLVARYGFVYDHTGPVGGIVRSAPSLKKLKATFVGRPAHAGLEPELGRSAITAAATAISRMPLGRIDAETTANIGTVEGGTATNVVAERCTITAECRSRDEQALSGQLTTMLDALTWAATECEVDLETTIHSEFTGYRLADSDPQVDIAGRALRACGYEPYGVDSGGGSDVNALLVSGLPSVNLCNAMVDVHTDRESIAVADLERMVDVTLAIIDQAREGAAA